MTTTVDALSIRSCLAALPDGARRARAPHGRARRALAAARRRRRSASRALVPRAVSQSSSACATSSAPGTRARCRLGPEPGRTDAAPELELDVADLGAVVPRRLRLHAPRARRPRARARARRARASFRPRAHAAAALLPGGVLMFDVRPTENLEDFQQRVVRDRPVLRRPSRRRAHGEVQPEPAVRANARRARGRRDRRRRRRLPVRDGGSGRHVAAARASPSSACIPTHRRRGVLRAMMRAQIDDIHARGEPIAALWASEETIYGRFGYGMASFTGEISLAREHSEFAQPVRAARTRAPARADEALELLPPIWERALAADAGMFSARAPVVGEPGRRTIRRSAARAAARSASRCSSSTASRRPTRSTGTTRSGTRARRRHARRRRGDRRDTARDRARSGASCSTSTGRRRSTPTCCRSTTRSSSCSPSRDG